MGKVKKGAEYAGHDVKKGAEYAGHDVKNDMAQSLYLIG